jgi:hypothetical protein
LFVAVSFEFGNEPGERAHLLMSAVAVDSPSFTLECSLVLSSRCGDATAATSSELVANLDGDALLAVEAAIHRPPFPLHSLPLNPYPKRREQPADRHQPELRLWLVLASFTPHPFSSDNFVPHYLSFHRSFPY